MRSSILRFKKAEFEGAGLFKRPTIVELEKRGRVLICGDEGAGKTTIPEVLTTTVWGQGSPARVGKEAFTDKTIANEETGYTSSVFFSSGFDAASRDVVITQSHKHPVLKSKYSIDISGDTRKTPTTKPEIKKLLNRVVPITHDEWMGVGYLNQGGMHGLLSGTKAVKQQYLTAVFGLSFWQDLITEAKLEEKNYKGFADSTIALASRYATLGEEEATVLASIANEPDPVEIEEQVRILTERLQEMAARVSRFNAVGETAAAYRDVCTQWETAWSSDVTPAERLVELQGVVKEKRALLKERRQMLEVGVKARARMDSLNNALTKAKKAVVEAKARLEELSQEGELPTEETLNECEALWKRAKVLGVIPKERAESSRPVVSADEAERALHSAESMLDFLRNLRNAADGNCDCPTCGSPLPDIDGKLKSMEAELAGHKKDVAAALWDMGASMTMTEVRDARAKREARADATRALTTAKKQRETAKTAIDDEGENLNEVEVEVLREEVTALAQEVDALIEERSATEEAASLKDKMSTLAASLKGVNVDTLEADKAKAKVRWEKAKEVHEEAMGAKRRIDQSTARLDSIRKQRADLDAQIQKAAHIVQMVDTYEKEVIPYLTALRSARVHERVGVLESILPAYVKEMSSRQYEGARLELDISDDLDEIDLVITPSRFNPNVTPLQASGGQRRRFTVALLGAFREVSPRTSNIMFFDEPLADLQPDGKHRFLNRLLPLMMERCPGLESIFVIAHDREALDASNAQFDDVWKVTANPTGSILTTGNLLHRI